MGHEIENTAIARGHEIIARIDNEQDWGSVTGGDVIIDFTTAEAAPGVARIAFQKNIPFVSGTTGWNNTLNEIKEEALRDGKTFFYSSNFSIGANIFFNINKRLASFLKNNPDYSAHIHEVHHIHKKDAPSGTAIYLANDILPDCNKYSHWTSNNDDKSGLLITSERVDEVPGTHIVTWDSEVDSIELKHTAHSRKGLALGAIIAAEWVVGRKGVFGMNDLLSMD